MNKRIKNLLLILVASISFTLFACNKNNKKDDYEVMQELIETSVNEFNKAKINISLNSEDMVVYSEIIDINRSNENITYTKKVKQLADDLYEESLYDEQSSDGTLSKEETNNMFIKKDQFNKSKVENFIKEDSVISFTINKENYIEVFDLKIQDLNKIADGGIKVTLKTENNKINEYTYKYVTSNNLQVSIIVSFEF